MPTLMREGAFRRWYWLLVPLLAIAAYVTVLRIGFLGDDFTLLSQADSRKVSFQSLLPPEGWFFYRPVGLLFVWDLGVRLWGSNPFPFHPQGLLFHAVTSLALGLWLAEATGRRVLGWLAGALFAVFPLHLEAVGWVAAQWDALSTMFALLSLWVFTVWWRYRVGSDGAGAATFRPYLHLVALLLYALALFTKDSLLTFLPLYALSAWMVTRRPTRRDVVRVAYALLPFVGVLALNLALRLAYWGNLGGYPGLRADYPAFFWEGLAGQLRPLLAPINSTVLGNAVAQIVGAASVLGLLVGIALYGRMWGRLLLVAAAWVLLAIVPVLNLPVKQDDLQQNRLLYLASAGYCVALSALLYSALRFMRKTWQVVGLSLVGALLLLSIGVCWLQLRPWHTATVQADDLNQELVRLIPPPEGRRPTYLTWYVQDPPHDYKGAYILHLAIGAARHFLANKDDAAIIASADAAAAPLASDATDAFALSFVYKEEETRYHVDFAQGITTGEPTPSGERAGSSLRVWDFTNCAPDAVSAWRVAGAQASCEPGQDNGLVLRNSDGDTQLIGPPLEMQPIASGSRFVRLRVSVRYPSDSRETSVSSQWFWSDGDSAWSEARSTGMNIRERGVPNVYWTFVPAEEAGEKLASLRFDPADDAVNAAVQWIAVDLVK